MNDTHFDVIVIGGGTTGLSGALTLARARRSVLVIDAGEPRNAPADGIHGYLTRDGLAPSELVRLGEDEVTRYGGQVVLARATSARADGPGFAVGTDDGREVTARRLLVTTGLVDELPDIPGLRDLWGHDVLHCPYCHGWEVRDQPVGVLATSPFAVHQALLFRQWSPDVTLFLHTSPDPAPDEWEQLAARDIAVVDGEVTALETRDGRLSGVRLTSVPGVRVAGNVTDLMAGVVGAAAAGVAAAAALNADLVADDARRAVEQRRSPFSAASEARVAEIVTGERRHGLTPARS
jgi:thioredoxin reductase